MPRINSVLSLKKNTGIIWPLVLIQFLRLIGVSDQVTFVIILGYIIFMFINAKKIIIPHIIGMKLYLIFIVYAAFIGLLMQSTRAWGRDLFYILPTITIIFSGYFCNEIYSEKSVLKTVYVIGFMISIVAFIKLLTNPSVLNEFSDLRQTIGIEIYEVSMIFVAFVIEKIFFGKTIFSKVMDILILFLMLAQIILSFGRTQIIMIVAMLVFALICNIIYNRSFINSIVRITIIALVGASFIYACIMLVPNDIYNDFSEKWETTSTEINTDQEIDTELEALENWRAYEMQSATKQWKKSNVFAMLFGKGLGEGIKIKFVPVLWKQLQITENGKIAILHNGYYTVLVKGGIIGTIAMIILYLSGLYMMFRYIKKYPSLAKELVIAGAFSVGGAIQGYVVNGIFTLHYMFCWAVYMGYVNSKLNNAKAKVDNEN